MLATRLIQLIEAHAESLTQATIQDLLNNERTRSFHQVPRSELESRVAAIYRDLGRWIGDPDENAVRDEFEYWGRARSHQGIPLSQVVYGVIVTKQHLRRFIREHGMVMFAGDRVSPGEVVPVQLYGIQELNYMVGDFFDNALYYLTRGYEAAAAVGSRKTFVSHAH